MSHSKYTPERKQKFLSAIEKGADKKTAAAFAGWSEKTLYNYLQDYPDLATEILEAESKILMVAINTIMELISTDWKVAAWFLNRRGGNAWQEPRSQADPTRPEIMPALTVTPLN